MRPPNETAPGDQGPFQLSLEEATKAQDTSRPRQKPTQQEKLLGWLMAEDALCATTALERYVARAAASIYRLRRQGYLIATRPCSRPGHRHDTHQIEYVLEALPHEPRG